MPKITMISNFSFCPLSPLCLGYIFSLMLGDKKFLVQGLVPEVRKYMTSMDAGEFTAKVNTDIVKSSGLRGLCKDVFPDTPQYVVG